jgi:hypothetical protein
MSGRLSNDMLAEAKYECLDLIELLGTLVGQLGEAVADSDSDNLLGASIVADDALLTFAEMETKLSEVAAKVAKWKQWADEEGGGA